MNETTSPSTPDTTVSRSTAPRPLVPGTAELVDVDHDGADRAAERLRARRAALQSRHAQGLTRLMEQRDDLRGVHALADLVDDAVRWTA